MKVSKEIKKLVDKHDVDQLKKGISIEREHDTGVTDVVQSDLDVLKIALAHLEEDPAYYDHLEDMESEFKNELQEMCKLSGLVLEQSNNKLAYWIESKLDSLRDPHKTSLFIGMLQGYGISPTDGYLDSTLEDAMKEIESSPKLKREFFKDIKRYGYK